MLLAFSIMTNESSSEDISEDDVLVSTFVDDAIVFTSADDVLTSTSVADVLVSTSAADVRVITSADDVVSTGIFELVVSDSSLCASFGPESDCACKLVILPTSASVDDVMSPGSVCFTAWDCCVFKSDENGSVGP